jgi:glycosyltransferase involved in cell wall biosynthesis
LRQIGTIRWIMQQVEEFQPDVVHFQLGHLWFNFALPILKRRYPIVFTVHDPRRHLGDRGAGNTPQWVMDFGYHRADRIIVHGTQLKLTLTDELGISPDRIHVIPHIAIGQRDCQPVVPDANVILFFGRIWPYKGLEYLIRAQPAISRKIPDAKFLICGRGEDVDRYRGMLVDPDCFVFHDRWITDDERADFFQEANVVVLPYVEATQSGVVPIAYAHSKPVVATRTGGLPDVIDNGRTGLLVEPCNEVELAQAVVTILKDKALQKSMGEAGNRKLKSEWSVPVVCQQTAEVYRAAMDDRKTSKNHDKTEFSKSA